MVGAETDRLRRAIARRAPPAAQRTLHRARRARVGLTGDARIFGIGLSRTGTTSLNRALELLSYRALHFPADATTRAEVMAGIDSRAASVRLSILDSCDALTDTPACALFEALDAAYPGSRFILTTRDKRSWLESNSAYRAATLQPQLDANGPRVPYIRALAGTLYGGAEFDFDRFGEAYDDYHARVERHFAGRPGDLLQLNVLGGEGWDKLCGFLGRPRPDVDFPQVNLRPPTAQPHR